MTRTLFADDHDVTPDDEHQVHLIRSLPDDLRPAVTQKGGVLAGIQLGQREVVRLAAASGWNAAVDLAIVGMVCGAESWRYTRARNVNTNGSVDVGLMQINIPASQAHTQYEEELYDPVVNMGRARKLFTTKINTAGEMRGWQPWSTYNSGLYLRDTYRAWGLLGLLNFYASVFAPDAPLGTLLRVPFVSTPELRGLYPDVVL